jgi:hypothetical protein
MVQYLQMNHRSRTLLVETLVDLVPINLTTRIKVEDKLGFFLYMINHNASFEDLQVFFGHSNDTIHRVIKHFFNIVIPALSMQFLKLPTIEVHPKIHGNNKFYPYIKAISFLVLMC